MSTAQAAPTVDAVADFQSPPPAKKDKRSHSKKKPSTKAVAAALQEGEAAKLVLEQDRAIAKAHAAVIAKLRKKEKISVAVAASASDEGSAVQQSSSQPDAAALSQAESTKKSLSLSRPSSSVALATPPSLPVTERVPHSIQAATALPSATVVASQSSLTSRGSNDSSSVCKVTLVGSPGVVFEKPRVLTIVAAPLNTTKGEPHTHQIAAISCLFDVTVPANGSCPVDFGYSIAALSKFSTTWRVRNWEPLLMNGIIAHAGLGANMERAPRLQVLLQNTIDSPYTVNAGDPIAVLEFLPRPKTLVFECFSL